MPETPLSVRFPADLLERLDRVADAMATRTGGAKVARVEVIRVAVKLGLDALESKLGVKHARRDR
jgi:metal-responsive CopG/Arc/MetJ family transcriptional regulator